MDFIFHLPYFCTAAAAVAEILTVCFVNIEFRERKKLILNQILLVSCVPKLPESTRRKQTIFKKGSLFYCHCGRKWHILTTSVG
jgi:hypothetical protein